MKLNHVTIQGWMYDIGCDDLKEIVAYAIIFGFSQDGETKFEGSLQYLMRLLKCSKPTVIAALKSLEEKELIRKEQVTIQGVTFNRYSAILQVVKNLYTPSKISLPNNNIDTPIINNNPTLLFKEEVSTIPPIVPHKEKRFVKPTLEQVAAYVAERKSDVNPQRFIDFYESKGWMVGSNHMKDWKAAVRTWEVKEVKQSKTIAYGNSDRCDGAASTAAPRQRDYSLR